VSDNQQPSFFGGLPPRENSTTDVSEAEHSPTAGSSQSESSTSGSGESPQYQQPQPASGGKRNTLALVAFIGSFFISLVGIIAGHIALKQIKRTGERGRGFALWGTIIGYLGLVGTAIAIAVLVAGAAAVSQLAGDLQSSVDDTTAADSAANDALIASGGGAVEGHVVSAELCTALDAFVLATSNSGGGLSAEKIEPELLTALDGLAAIDSPNQAVYVDFVALMTDPNSVEGIEEASARSTDFSDAAQEDTVACM
jgi:hypothetical protein